MSREDDLLTDDDFEVVEDIVDSLDYFMEEDEADSEGRKIMIILKLKSYAILTLFVVVALTILGFIEMGIYNYDGIISGTKKAQIEYVSEITGSTGGSIITTTAGNGSVYDYLTNFYSEFSSTQGGYTSTGKLVDAFSSATALSDLEDLKVNVDSYLEYYNSYLKYNPDTGKKGDNYNKKLFTDSTIEGQSFTNLNVAITETLDYMSITLETIISNYEIDYVLNSSTVSTLANYITAVSQFESCFSMITGYVIK